MQERYLEIRFYYYIVRLLTLFRYDMRVLDIIEAYCSISGADSGVIKSLVRQIKEQSGSINTYKEEAVYIARQCGIPYRRVAHDMNISLATQVRLNKYYDLHPEMYKNTQRRTNNIEYNNIYKFMKTVDIMKEL